MPLEEIEDTMEDLPPEGKSKTEISFLSKLSDPSEEDKRSRCGECDKPLDPDAVFCKYCGTKVQKKGEQ